MCNEDQEVQAGKLMDAVGEMNRLRWLCTHRSMLEMDLLLGGFLDRHFAHLSPELAAAFVALAEMQDPDIWPLVTGKRASTDPLQAEILEMLRHGSKN